MHKKRLHVVALCVAVVLAGCAAAPGGPTLPPPVSLNGVVAVAHEPGDTLAPIHVRVTVLGEPRLKSGAYLFSDHLQRVALDDSGPDGITRLYGLVGQEYFALACFDTCERSATFRLPPVGLNVTIESYPRNVTLEASGVLAVADAHPMEQRWQTHITWQPHVDERYARGILDRIGIMDGVMTWTAPAGFVSQFQLGVLLPSGEIRDIGIGQSCTTPPGPCQVPFGLWHEVVDQANPGITEPSLTFVVTSEHPPQGDLPLALMAFGDLRGDGCDGLPILCCGRHVAALTDRDMESRIHANLIPMANRCFRDI